MTTLYEQKMDADVTNVKKKTLFIDGTQESMSEIVFTGDIVISEFSKVTIPSLSVIGSLELMFGSSLVINGDLSVKGYTTINSNCNVLIKGNAETRHLKTSDNCSIEIKGSSKIELVTLGLISSLCLGGHCKTETMIVNDISRLNSKKGLEVTKSFEAYKKSVVTCNGLIAKSVYLEETTIETQTNVLASSVKLKRRSRLLVKGDLTVEDLVDVGNSCSLDIQGSLDCMNINSRYLSQITIANTLHSRANTSIDHESQMTIGKGLCIDKVLDIGGGSLVRVTDGTVKAYEAIIVSASLSGNCNVCIESSLEILDGCLDTNNVVALRKINMHTSSSLRTNNDIKTPCLSMSSNCRLNALGSLFIDYIDEVNESMDDESTKTRVYKKREIILHNDCLVTINGNAHINGSLRMGCENIFNVKGTLDCEGPINLDTHGLLSTQIKNTRTDIEFLTGTKIKKPMSIINIGKDMTLRCDPSEVNDIKMDGKINVTGKINYKTYTHGLLDKIESFKKQGLITEAGSQLD